MKGPFDKMPQGLAYLHWCRSHADRLQGGDGEGLRYYEYRLYFKLQHDSPCELNEVNAQLGLAVVRQQEKVAQMKSDEFFVPPSLWGAGLGGTFVEGLKNKLSPDVERFEIVLPPRSSRRRDRASREEYNDLLAFYKGADFDHDPINDKFTWFPPRRTQ